VRTIIREIGFCLLVLAVTTFFVLAAIRSMPLSDRDRVQQERQQIGFDEPLVLQYAQWWKNVLFRFDFSSSMRDGQPVRTLLLSHAWKTITLTLSAMILMLSLAIPLGLGQAYFVRSRWWKVLFAVVDALSSLPVFVLAYLVVALVIKFVYPAIGFFPQLPNAGEPAYHWVLFMGMLAFILGTADGILGEMIRLIRLEARDFLSREFALALRARGVRPGKHLAKNVFLPVFSLLMSRMTYFLSGAVVLEYIFTFRGLGYLTWDRITTGEGTYRDEPVILGVCFAAVALVLICRFTNKMAIQFISPYKGK
jgi:peptide/nickel transport system permease protein